MNWWGCTHKKYILTNTVHFFEKVLPDYIIIIPDDHVLEMKKSRQCIIKQFIFHGPAISQVNAGIHGSDRLPVHVDQQHSHHGISGELKRDVYCTKIKVKLSA